MNPLDYGCLAILLIAAEWIYIRVARRWGIIDKPNERSLHTNWTTVRGGGIIFCLAVFIACVCAEDEPRWFLWGFTLVSAASFLDDVRPVAIPYRLGAQIIGCSLALIQTGVLPGYGWLLAIVLLLAVGLLNVYNFMDGINGMTAYYSLVTVGTLWYWFSQWSVLEKGTVVDWQNQLLPAVFIALLVFSYFNARRQAICFAGDVGSVSVAFVIGYGLLGMALAVQSFLPVLLLTVYGVDSGLTILLRLYWKQNIFQPHQLHLFQILAQRKSWSHLRVSILYSLVQVSINIVILQAMRWPLQQQWLLAGVVLGVVGLMYTLARKRLVSNQSLSRA